MPSAHGMCFADRTDGEGRKSILGDSVQRGLCQDCCWGLFKRTLPSARGGGRVWRVRAVGMLGIWRHQSSGEEVTYRQQASPTGRPLHWEASRDRNCSQHTGAGVALFCVSLLPTMMLTSMVPQDILGTSEETMLTHDHSNSPQEKCPNVATQAKLKGQVVLE